MIAEVSLSLSLLSLCSFETKNLTNFSMGNTLSLVASMVTPLGIGTAIGISMRDDVKSWYPTIRKPAWYVVPKIADECPCENLAHDVS